MSIPALVALAVAATSASAFVLVYTVLAPWRSTQYGRNLVANATAMVGLLILIALEVRLGGGYWGRDVFQTSVLAWIAVVFLRRITLLVKAQRGAGTPREKVHS